MWATGNLTLQAFVQALRLFGLFMFLLLICNPYCILQFSRWPAFVPVHDPSRKAYIGIQNMGTVFTRRFESDCIKSQVPIKLMHLEGLYELFVSKFVSA